MKETNSRPDLRAIHKEFLESRYFSALSIITPKEDWLWISKDGAGIDKKYGEAKKRKIFNLVVIDGQRVSGFINVEYIRPRDGKYEIEWEKMESVENYRVPEGSHLFDLLKRMVKDAKQIGEEREMSPIYFVVKSEGKSEEPIGIISFWDLNRAPAYILSYPILVYLEHTLIIKIEKSHSNWVSHKDLLEKISESYSGRRYRAIRNRFKKFLEEPMHDYQVLSEWGLPELAYFYENDPHMEMYKDSVTSDLIQLFTNESKLRNILAHTVNLIVDGNDFERDLENLEKIWNYGKTVFFNFIDPKVSYRPWFSNEK